MSLRSLITLESGVVDSQFLRNRSDVAIFHDILRYVQEETSTKLTEELAREIHSFDRKERQALLLKQSIFIDNLRQELERAYMSMEDGILKSVSYREKRLRYMTKVMSLLQVRETKVCNYGHKLMERAEEFAKRFVIETLDWRSTHQDDVAWNHDMWQLQSQVAKNIGTAPSTTGVYLPIDVHKFSRNIGEELLEEDFVWDGNEPVKYDDKTGQPIPNRRLWNLSLSLLKLIRVLQAIQISCASGQICDGSDKNAASSTESFRIVGHAVKILDKIVLADGEDANVYISTVFKALSTILHSPIYVNVHLNNVAKNENQRGTEWKWGDGFSDDGLHQRLLYWIRIVHHCRSFYVQKLGIFPTFSLQEFSLGTASLDEIVDDPSMVQGNDVDAKPSGYTFATFNRNEYQDIFIVGDHNGLFSLGSPTVIHILRSVNACMQSSFSQYKSHELLPQAMKELVRASLKFCENAISSYNFRLNGADGYNFNDVALIEAVEGEIFECIRVATTTLNNGHLNEDLIQILRGVITLTKTRSSNFFLASVILQCLQSAIYSFVHQRNLPASRKFDQDIKEKKRTKDIVRIPYADLQDMISPSWTQLIFHITSLHPNSLTIQHVGLATLRMLLRPPFMTRSNIQDLFEEDEDYEEEGEEEEGEEEEAEEEDTGNGNQFKKWKTNLWKTDVPSKVYEVFGYPKSAWSLTTMIFFCGESHMQSVEVVEQVLLLVQHLAQVSFLCRITLSERDIEKILNRIIEAMPHHVYIMALVELVHETLAWTD